MEQEQIKKTVGLMMRVLRIHRSRFEEELSGIGVHHSQHRMLMYIYRRGEAIAQKELAEHFEISAAAASGTVKKLEKGGYVRISPAEDDMRRYDIVITEKGKKVAKQSREIFDSVDRQMVDGFTDEELETFRLCLEKMKYNIERRK